MAAAPALDSPAPVETLTVQAQPGPQELFQACRADIGIIGGSVYGGKSWVLTVEPLKWVTIPRFSCVTFRRTTPDIRNPGSLWDESKKWYPDWEAEPREQQLEWRFPSGAVVKMAGLQHEGDVLSWKSAQITVVQFDQLEEFTEYQFWYMRTRNRDPSGQVNAYCRASCNALADTWLAVLLAWWWDPETGYAIEERSGVARFFLRVNDQIQWSTIACRCDAPEAVWARAVAEARAEMVRRFPAAAGVGGKYVQSLAFIRAKLEDNVVGVEADPDYEARVRTASLVEQERLLSGNWKIRPAAGKVFNRAWFDFVDAIPRTVTKRVRYWDKGGTSQREHERQGGKPHYTVGTRMSTLESGLTLVEDVIVGMWHAGEREKVIRATAELDAEFDETTVTATEQEPGSGGKDQARFTVLNLAGHAVYADRPTGDLVVRADPLAAQAQVGNVKLVRAPWNAEWLNELHAFPTPGVADDRVSSAAGAFKFLRFGTVQKPPPQVLVRPRA